MNVEVIMIRHAQSTWNAEHRFTGWANPPLTSKGEHEAARAADLLSDHGYTFDKAYTSVLSRAQRTADILIERLGLASIAKTSDWRLNERHYGALQGQSKEEMSKMVGEEQVWKWRRSYLELPPGIDAEDQRHPRFDPVYAELKPEQLPCTENLAMTLDRVSSLWHEIITKDIKQGQRILISAHGNTLRALIMHLSGMRQREVEQFEIPTATPIVYRFNEFAEAIDWHYLERHNQKNSA